MVVALDCRMGYCSGKMGTNLVDLTAARMAPETVDLMAARRAGTKVVQSDYRKAVNSANLLVHMWVSSTVGLKVGPTDASLADVKVGLWEKKEHWMVDGLAVLREPKWANTSVGRLV